MCAASPSKNNFRDASARRQSSASASYPFAASAPPPATQPSRVANRVRNSSRSDRLATPRCFRPGRTANTAAKSPANACSAARTRARGSINQFIGCRRNLRQNPEPAERIFALVDFQRRPPAIAGRQIPWKPSQPAMKSHSSVSRLAAMPEFDPRPSPSKSCTLIASA